jgi:hypothetical protein
MAMITTIIMVTITIIIIIIMTMTTIIITAPIMHTMMPRKSARDA